MTTKSVATTGTSFAIVFSTGIAEALMRGIGCFICGTGRRGIRFRWGFVLAMAVCITQCPFTLSLIVSRPMSAVSKIGDRVRMECSRDRSSRAVDWEFAPADTNITSYIYTGRQIPADLTSRYKIDTDNRTRYDIVIDSVDSSHAGTYICTPIEEGVSNAPSASAQLIVLESDPVCNTNASASTGSTFLEGDGLRLWCTVSYSGNWIPFMEWNNTQVQRISYTSDNTRATSSLPLPLNSDDDGVAIACKTSFNSKSRKLFRNPRVGETLADNVPNYQYLWTFTPRVLYAPNKITIIPMKSVYVVGERLVCSANGNPTPTYEWMEIETNRTSHGSVLTIEDNMRSDENHDFRCTAYNAVAGGKSQFAETVTFSVKAGASSKVASTSLIAVIALGFAVVLSVKA